MRREGNKSYNYLVILYSEPRLTGTRCPDLLCLYGSRLGKELETLAWNLRGRSEAKASSLKVILGWR